MIPILTLWVIIASITAFIAKHRSRSPAVWFVLGILLNIFALIFLLLLPEKEKNASEEHAEKNVSSLNNDLEKKLDFNQIQDNNEPYIRVHPHDLELEWWYLKYEKKSVAKKGPFTFLKLKEYAENEDFTKNTYIWSEELSNWTSLKTITNAHLLFNDKPNFQKENQDNVMDTDFNSYEKESKA